MSFDSGKLLLALVILSSSFHSIGQPYKCTTNGKTIYQQTKCDGGTTVNTSGVGKADVKSPGATQAQRDIAAMKRKEVIDNAILERNALVGMTADEVIKSWGNPNKVNRTVAARSVSEQWIYRRGTSGDDQYIYLDEGVVTAIQSPR